MYKEREEPNWPSTSAFQLPWCHNQRFPIRHPLSQAIWAEKTKVGKAKPEVQGQFPAPPGIPAVVIKASTSTIIITGVTAPQNAVHRKLGVTRATGITWKNYLFSFTITFYS